MARFCRYLLSWVLLGLGGASGAFAQQPVIYDRPVLRVDPGMHMAPITDVDTDLIGKYSVTGSNDRTIRVWSVSDGRLIQTIPIPIGPGNIGQIYAVALSPDGKVIAAGGYTGDSGRVTIYLFDRPTGKMIKRIGGLPNSVYRLAFSPDGERLVTTLGGANGMRMYDRTLDWLEIARDTDYGGSTLGLGFAPEGLFATASDDGFIRLYSRAGRKIRKVDSGHPLPSGLAFNPDGDRLAVGSDSIPSVRIFDSSLLKELYTARTNGIASGNLNTVAWSHDGKTLFAGGAYRTPTGMRVLSWASKGSGSRREYRVSSDSIRKVHPLQGGDLLVVTNDPIMVRLDMDGSSRWSEKSGNVSWTADFRDQHKNFRVSFDGSKVEFGFELHGLQRAVFDVDVLELSQGESELVSSAVQNAMAISDWHSRVTPKLSGKPLSLIPLERSHSLAIHPDGQRFALGGDWYLRVFDRTGTLVWSRAAPGEVWAVNVSGDGRYLVAAYGDGTIRWHHFETGEEVLAFFPLADQSNWVAWEPDGRFASTLGIRSALKWHVNKGWDTTPVLLPASQIPNSHRPAVIKRILQDGSTMKAVYAAEESERKKAIKRLTGADFAPGAQLHVLTIGVGDYGESAKSLSLKWADKDADDLYSALNTQSEDLWPYQAGFKMTLHNEEAKGSHILDQLTKIRDRMASATRRDDLAVIHFSGHGMTVGKGADREFYLLPHDVQMASEARQRRSGISGTELRQAIAGIAQYGRVLLLLDACRSGAFGTDGKQLAMNADLLRSELAMNNVTVLTSSSGTQVSREEDSLRNGAFTEVVLEALGDAGDANKNGMVSVSELVGYVTAQVQALTGGKQKPVAVTRFHGELFATRQ